MISFSIKITCSMSFKCTKRFYIVCIKNPATFSVGKCQGSVNKTPSQYLVHFFLLSIVMFYQENIAGEVSIWYVFFCYQLLCVIMKIKQLRLMRNIEGNFMHYFFIVFFQHLCNIIMQDCIYMYYFFIVFSNNSVWNILR